MLAQACTLLFLASGENSADPRVSRQNLSLLFLLQQRHYRKRACRKDHGQNADITLPRLQIPQATYSMTDESALGQKSDTEA